MRRLRHSSLISTPRWRGAFRPTIAALKLLVGYLESARNTHALTAPELQHAVVAHIYDLMAVALGATREASEVAHGRGLRAAHLRAAKAFILHNICRQDLSAGALRRIWVLRHAMFTCSSRRRGFHLPNS